jgi:hypothetical protein
MTDMGLLHYFLGLEIIQNDSGIKMSQSKYSIDLLDRFHMIYFNPAPTPFQSRVRLEDVVHHLWLIVLDIDSWWGVFSTLHTLDLDISYVVGSVSRYMQEPHELHWKEAKRILIYVKGTTSFGIHYATGSSLDLVGYTDSDWAGDRTDHKSTSRICPLPWIRTYLLVK